MHQSTLYHAYPALQPPGFAPENFPLRLDGSKPFHLRPSGQLVVGGDDLVHLSVRPIYGVECVEGCSRVVTKDDQVSPLDLPHRFEDAGDYEHAHHLLPTAAGSQVHDGDLAFAKLEGLLGWFLFPAMKLLLVTAFCIVALPFAIHARLGETEAEIVARYGSSTAKTTPEDAMHYPLGFDLKPTASEFRKDGFIIAVVFLGGKSIAESYRKEDGSAVTADEQSTLLNLNRGASEWGVIVSTDAYTDYCRKDDEFEASYRRTPRRLEIVAMQYEAGHQAAAKKPMSGF